MGYLIMYQLLLMMLGLRDVVIGDFWGCSTISIQSVLLGIARTSEIAKCVVFKTCVRYKNISKAIRIYFLAELYIYFIIPLSTPQENP